ncbi:MAG TPA: sigma-70 family RNA polymerase sigma factor [Acidimicrobiia bacterium]|nr:sigma-70 family RNA polymerase sigma factor [Acidimicrobiia bacterium]
MGERERTFEAFYEDEYAAVVRSLTLALRDESLAEEAAQEAFIRAFVYWRRVGRMDRPAGWVYVVAIRVASRRRRRREPEAVVVVDGPFADVVVDRESLRVAIEQLPERQRMAVVLRYVADCSLAEVASAMGCAVGTAKSTLHAALTRLGAELTPDIEEVHDAH